MRVIAGSARGVSLDTIPEWTTRPTTDRVKENLFNIINFQLYDAIVTDFFAGSGALCIEALSRGAREAHFVEKNPACIKVIKGNLEKTKLSEKARLYPTDYEAFVKKAVNNGMKFDIIFLDPPHAKGLGEHALALIEENDLLSETGLIVVEHHTKENYPLEVGKIKQYKKKKYGNTTLSFYQF